MKTIDDFNFKGRLVLLRSDINSDIKNGKVLMNERIKESSIKIKELKKKGARVIIVAHQSRKGKKDFYSDWGDWFASDTHCRICGEIKIEENLRINSIKIYLIYSPISQSTHQD